MSRIRTQILCFFSYFFGRSGLVVLDGGARFVMQAKSLESHISPKKIITRNFYGNHWPLKDVFKILLWEVGD